MQTELQRQHARHKAFHASIARAAAKIEPPLARFIRIVPIAPPIVPKSVESPNAIDTDPDEIAWATAICAPDIAARKKIVPTIATIQRAVCQHYKVLKSELSGPSREAWIIKPRFVAMYLCRQLARRSLPYIGKQFGGRDHATALNAIRKCAMRMQRDPELAIDVEYISDKFENPVQ